MPLIVFLSVKSTINVDVSSEFKNGAIFFSAIISSLFIIQIIFVEDDYLLRIGTIEFDFEIKKYLFEHLLRGDSGDGVPNVLSPDNVLVDHIRQSPMTKKKMAEWWENKDRLKEVMSQEVFRNYIRNREMIDLDRTPEAIKKESIDQYENYKYPKRSNILTYLIENRMKMLIENAGEF